MILFHVKHRGASVSKPRASGDDPAGYRVEQVSGE